MCNVIVSDQILLYYHCICEDNISETGQKACIYYSVSILLNYKSSTLAANAEFKQLTPVHLIGTKTAC